MSEDYPLPGQLWKHYNGITYRVLFIANEQSKNHNYQPTVVYETANRSSAEAAKWSHPLHDWNRSMTCIKEETAIHYISTHHQLMDENDRLLAEIARLRGRVEVLERVRAAALAVSGGNGDGRRAVVQVERGPCETSEFVRTQPGFQSQQVEQPAFCSEIGRAHV